MKNFCLVMLGILLLTFLTTGCRTARGVERDLDHVERHIEREL
jgi:predicted small secreted protein